MKVDLNQEIVDLKKNPMSMSFPSDVEMKAVGGDKSKLPKETLGNVLLNCLAAFPVKDRKQIFVINDIASRIINSPDSTIEISDDESVLLGDILFSQTFQEKEGGDKSGVYLHFVIAQAMQMINIKV